MRSADRVPSVDGRGYARDASNTLVLREVRAVPCVWSARNVALRMLAARFPDALPGAAVADGLLSFQREAVDRALGILARFGGVVIADSVGLGKTGVARCATSARSSGSRTPD